MSDSGFPKILAKYVKNYLNDIDGYTKGGVMNFLVKFLKKPLLRKLLSILIINSQFVQKRLALVEQHYKLK